MSYPSQTSRWTFSIKSPPSSSRGGRGQDDAAPAAAWGRAGFAPDAARDAPGSAPAARGPLPADGAAADDSAVTVAVGGRGREPGSVATLHAAAADAGRRTAPGKTLNAFSRIH